MNLKGPPALEGLYSFCCGESFACQPSDQAVVNGAGKHTVFVYRIRANVVREAGRILVDGFLARVVCDFRHQRLPAITGHVTVTCQMVNESVKMC